MSVIPRRPPGPPVFDPNDPKYFDARDLEAELKRTFQICHECRMCVGYCGSFPEVFKRVDRDIEGIKAVFPRPSVASERFAPWLEGHEPLSTAGKEGEVVLFATCYGEFNVPEVPRAAVLALEHNGYTVRFPGVLDDRDQGSLSCCG